MIQLFVDLTDKIVEHRSKTARLWDAKLKDGTKIEILVIGVQIPSLSNSHDAKQLTASMSQLECRYPIYVDEWLT